MGNFTDVVFCVQSRCHRAKNGRLSGTLFWHWYDRGVGPGKYGVRSNDSTFKLIVEHAEAMNAITGAPRYCAA